MVTINVRGKLGDVQRSSRDTFVPLVVTEIEPTLNPVPVSAAAAMIAIGREIAPFMNGENSDEEALNAIRSRMLTIGRKLDETGGIELMRSVFGGAMQFLVDEGIHVGRWIESVWDGIGQWLG
jgi:hypothetical protein